jgi:hypothetical protein
MIEAELFPQIESRMLDELRLCGGYERLLGRANKKQTALSGRDIPTQNEITRGLSRMERRLWYFQHRIGTGLPDDLEGWARESGFDSLAEFDTVLAKEWLFDQIAE